MLTIDHLRLFDFARQYHWEVQFSGYGGPFLPAHIINDTYITFEPGKQEYGPWEFAFPERAIRGKQLQMEIYEIADYAIIRWLKQWQQSIQDDNFRVKLLGQSGVTQQMILHRLSPIRTPIETEILLVIPEGDILVGYSSDKAGTLNISLNLVVVGKY